MATITVRKIGEVAILDVKGKLSFEETSIKQTIKSLLDEGRRNFLVNLSDVPYLGSWGINQIVSALPAIRSRQGRFALIVSTQPVRDVLHVTRLDTVFSIYEEEAEALAEFS